MSVVRFGDTGPVFGLAAETTGFAQEFNIKQTPQEATVLNNIGETVTVAYFNPKYEGSLTLVQSSAGTLPTFLVAVSVALVNATEVAKVILHEIDRKPEQTGFQKHTYSMAYWPSLGSI